MKIRAFELTDLVIEEQESKKNFVNLLSKNLVFIALNARAAIELQVKSKE